MRGMLWGEVLQHAYIIRLHLQQLKQMLIEEWALLPQEMLHQLVLSMRRRCEATIAIPASVISAVNGHKTFGPTDITRTYSVYTRKVFGGIGHRAQALLSGIRCSNH
ncbi:hypothetical protein TNCV_4776711 [Trichonephila clavipes]|nr:hypothetical protein TNCV_4776711 [Trichonephila clavipes]